MSDGLDWGIAQPRTNVLGDVINSLQVGQQLGIQQQRRGALGALAQNPDDQNAFNALLAVDPATANQIVQTRAAQAQIERANLARNAFAAVLGSKYGSMGGQQPAPSAQPTAAGAQPQPAQPGDVTVQAQGPKPTIADVAKADPEMAMKLVDAIGKMDDNQRKQVADQQDTLGSVAFKLAKLPYAQRAAALMDAAPLLQQHGITPKQIEEFDPSDANLQSVINISTGAKALLDDATKKRGQDMESATAAAGRAVTMRGQNMTAATAAHELAFKREQLQNSMLSPEAVQAVVQQLRAGDTSALQNIGRGNQGALNISMVRNELARQLQAEGKTGADIAAANLQFFGQKAGARQVGAMGAKIDYGTNELSASIPLAARASSAIPRHDFVPLNQVEQMLARGESDPKLKDFAVKTNAVINAYNMVAGRAGTGIAEREHNANMLRTADSPEAYQAALNAMAQEGRVTNAASKKTMNDITGAAGRSQIPNDVQAILHKYGVQH
jgi:hypothetical protein